MALEDIFKGFPGIEGFELGGPAGIAAGVGAAILAPILIPVVGQVGKPLTKAAIKQGLLAYEKGKEFFAEATEVFEDLVAEAKSELAQEHQNGKSEPEHNQPEIIVVND
ncbi:MAG: DUF5132 domain-containing protein [Coleofasciculus sp. S288]|nr:DUF5132 domain-containing protein [Coleofasciculus sp. S288]